MRYAKHIFVIGAVLVSGCAATGGTMPPPDPTVLESARSYEIPENRESSRAGSIYNPSRDGGLFEDNRARRPGDILRVILTEQTSAEKSASTSASRSSDLNISTPTVLGIPLEKGPLSVSAEMNSSNDFSGEGNSAQSNSLNGSITVVVRQTLPNGNLVIDGQKWLQLNQGSEFIKLSGVVRPQDIATDNSVRSTLIADARIQYSGSGFVSDSNREGWLHRFFTSVLSPL